MKVYQRIVLTSQSIFIIQRIQRVLVTNTALFTFVLLLMYTVLLFLLNLMIPKNSLLVILEITIFKLS